MDQIDRVWALCRGDRVPANDNAKRMSVGELDALVRETASATQKLRESQREIEQAVALFHQRCEEAARANDQVMGDPCDDCGAPMTMRSATYAIDE